MDIVGFEDVVLCALSIGKRKRVGRICGIFDFSDPIGAELLELEVKQEAKASYNIDYLQNME